MPALRHHAIIRMTGPDDSGPDAFNPAGVGRRTALQDGRTGEGPHDPTQEAPAVNHDDVLLSAEEEAAFVALTAALPAEPWCLTCRLGEVDDGSWPAAAPAGEAERPGALRYLLLAITGVVALVGGGGLAAFTSGVAAWCGMLTWTIGIVVTFCALVTGEAARPETPPTRKSPSA
jgi:hypothetical protein